MSDTQTLPDVVRSVIDALDEYPAMTPCPEPLAGFLRRQAERLTAALEATPPAEAP